MAFASPSAFETGAPQLRGSEEGLSSPLRTEAAVPLGGRRASGSGGASFLEEGQWLVVCLCAQWCRVCEQYRQGFEELAASHPQARFLWLDIEDRDDVAGDLEVETFPSLLIADAQHARFLGPLLPQLPVLSRLLHSLQRVGPATEAVSAQAQGLRERILAAGLV